MRPHAFNVNCYQRIGIFIVVFSRHLYVSVIPSKVQKYLPLDVILTHTHTHTQKYLQLGFEARNLSGFPVGSGINRATFLEGETILGKPEETLPTSSLPVASCVGVQYSYPGYVNLNKNCKEHKQTQTRKHMKQPFFLRAPAPEPVTIVVAWCVTPPAVFRKKQWEVCSNGCVLPVPHVYNI